MKVWKFLGEWGERVGEESRGASKQIFLDNISDNNVQGVEAVSESTYGTNLLQKNSVPKFKKRKYTTKRTLKTCITLHNACNSHATQKKSYGTTYRMGTRTTRDSLS